MSPILPVAIITPVFPPDRGGLALALARLVSRLTHHVPIEVFVVQPSERADITVNRLDGATVIHTAAPRWDEAQQQAFRLLQDRAPFRLIHGVYPSRVGFLATLAAGYFSIPVLLAARGNDLDRDIFRSDYQSGLLHALQQTDRVVGVSRALCRTAQALGAQNTQWIPNGVDCGQFQPTVADPALKRKLNLENADPVIGFAGELRRKKGLDSLLRAFGLLKQRYPLARLLLRRSTE
ncbi:MAG: glycosyltransferase family 4 protein [Candidatus Competibacteraceae bacterium]